ncbi:hypothetical protein GOBAR_DD27109 [Gossypium barbadense]|nr:hypothetical protein GOBAR_DD27109 [Gossypium barbadense]
MASSRLPRFIMEVAPPQFVTVMRQRTRTMLDTINEEDNLDGALAGRLGCFPLNDETYSPSSHGPTSTAVILRSYLIFRVCLNLVLLLWPAPKQCFTPRCTVNYCASTHFEGNQLALYSSGVSSLTTTHPLILQHQSLRTST